MTVPAKAATWTTLNPVDYIDAVYTEGNYRYVRYDFQRTPLISTPNGNTNGSFLQLKPSVDNPLKQQFLVYPLGTKFSGGPPLSSSSFNVAIAVSDFKSNAALTVSSSLELSLGVSYTAYSQFIEEKLVIDVLWSFAGYGGSGNYLGSIESTDYLTNKTLQDVYVDEQYSLIVPVNMTISPLSFEEKVYYIVPYVSLTYHVINDHEDICIDYWRLSCDDFSITTRIDMLYEQSLTMQKIEDQIGDLGDKLDNVDDQLGDLNDKADTIINGNDHQLNNAQDGSEKVEQNQDTMDDVLADLDEYDKLDATTGMEAIQNFLDQDGWLDVRELISPLLEWGPTVTIMLIVLSLINLSVILFGR